MACGTGHYGRLQSDTNSYPNVSYTSIAYITNEVTKVTRSLFLLANMTPKLKSLYLRHILSELIVLLAALIVAFLAQTLQISTKSTTQFLSNSFFKNGT